MIAKRKKGRMEPSDEDHRRVRERFGSECAACHSSCAVVFEVAHLFEDACKLKAGEERLIILCSGCNRAFEYAKGKNRPCLGSRVRPDEILALARRWHNDGNFPRAYAGNRLAAYLLERQQDYSGAVYALTHAIANTRPMRWAKLMLATAKEVERLCAEKESAVGLTARWQFLSRLVLVLYDYGDWQRALTVQDQTTTFSKKLGTDQRNPTLLAQEKHSTFRREGLIRSLMHSFGRKGSPRKIVDCLCEHAEVALTMGDETGFAIDLDFASVILTQVLGNLDAAHELAVKVIELTPKIQDIWTLAEFDVREAEFYRVRANNEPEARRRILATFETQNKRPIILEPAAAPGGSRERTLWGEASRLGIRFLDSDQRPKSISGESLLMTEAEFRDIVNAVAG
jgi:hypothetical protein